MNAAGHLVIAAAGTGGHVMPGLAVAEGLRARGWTVSWLGTRAGIERSIVEPRGIEFDPIEFSGFRGKGWRTLAFGGFRLLRAMVEARRVLRARRPRALFATGGYIAVPAGLAAGALGVPLVLLNPDAALLLSTRLVKPLAAAILCGFDGDAARRAGDRGLVTGNPVRVEIAAIPAPDERFRDRSGPLQLLVIGGSLGAKALNDAVPAALAQMAAGDRPHVIHQCGSTHVDAVRAAYAAAGVTADIRPFIDDIAARYAAADVVLARAGAITVTELAVAGVASILVPLVVSTTKHQRTNADFMAAHGAAIHLPQTELSGERLAELFGGLTRERLLAMAQAARAVGKPNAAQTVAAVIEKMAA